MCRFLLEHVNLATYQQIFNIPELKTSDGLLDLLNWLAEHHFPKIINSPCKNNQCQGKIAKHTKPYHITIM